MEEMSDRHFVESIVLLGRNILCSGLRVSTVRQSSEATPFVPEHKVGSAVLSSEEKDDDDSQGNRPPSEKVDCGEDRASLLYVWVSTRSAVASPTCPVTLTAMALLCNFRSPIENLNRAEFSEKGLRDFN